MIVLDEELLINPRDSSPFDAHGPVVEGIDSEYFACAAVPILSRPLFALRSTGGVLTTPPSSSSSCIPLTMACGVLSPYTAPPPADLHGMGSKGIPAPTPSATSGSSTVLELLTLMASLSSDQDSSSDASYLYIPATPWGEEVGEGVSPIKDEITSEVRTCILP